MFDENEMLALPAVTGMMLILLSEAGWMCKPDGCTGGLLWINNPLKNNLFFPCILEKAAMSWNGLEKYPGSIHTPMALCGQFVSLPVLNWQHLLVSKNLCRHPGADVL